MRYILFICILTSLCLTTSLAQSLRVGYYGETVTHYGFKVATEWPVLSHIKARNQARKEIIAAPAIALYRHPQNHIGLVFFPELTYRQTNKHGGIFEIGLSPAYFHYFLDGTTYKPNESGELQRVHWAGGNAFMPTVFVGIGKNLSVRRQVSLSWFTRLNVMQQRPYNTSSLIRFSLEAGVSLPIK
jgi:hypothetical protein